ncbi:hypothetical protein EVAR_84109_1 [Eumeta japonica]|uniref:Uncharacterized protein n=1 Tax=Eumeta variegata TaxID=151549 RepID=A0A4C1UYU7_EUMVA|nr:hypothetical protein EVAR_84109_1 [Eumeta japonica]
MLGIINEGRKTAKSSERIISQPERPRCATRWMPARAAHRLGNAAAPLPAPGAFSRLMMRCGDKISAANKMQSFSVSSLKDCTTVVGVD